MVNLSPKAMRVTVEVLKYRILAYGDTNKTRLHGLRRIIRPRRWTLFV
jgi:hypothetical protein